MCDKGAVCNAVGQGAQQVEMFFAPSQKLRIQNKPSRKVFTTTDIGIGELVLAPDTSKVTASSGKDAGSAYPNTACALTEVFLKPNCSGQRFFLQACTSEDNVSAFWLVEKTQVEKDANMVWQTMKLTSVCGVDFHGKVKVAPGVSHPESGENKTKGKDQKAVCLSFGDATNHDVTLPILVNNKKLKNGSVLLVYQAREANKRVAETKPISITSLAKKMRGAASSR